MQDYTGALTKWDSPTTTTTITTTTFVSLCFQFLTEKNSVL
jgi:hypothetical protein